VEDLLELSSHIVDTAAVAAHAPEEVDDGGVS
jgi:hypothetical protein